MVTFSKKIRYITNINLANGGQAKLAYILFGDSAKPLLVLCQSASINMFGWDPLFISKLSEEFRLFIFDYPGLTGLSEIEGAKEYSLSILTEVLYATFARLNLSPKIFCGYSMGGWIAQAYAAKHKLEKLILIATDAGGGANYPDQTLINQWELINHPLRLANCYHVLRLAFSDKFPIPRIFYLLYVFLKATNKGRRPKGKVSFYQQHIAQEWYTGIPIASKITIPTLVLYCDQDAIIPTAKQLDLVSKLKCVHSICFSGLGHAFIYQKPKYAAQQIINFAIRDNKCNLI